MEFQPGAVTLSDITGGTLVAGTVPLSRYVRAEESGENAAQVNFGGPATINIAQITFANLVAGDRIFLFAKGTLVNSDPAVSKGEWQIRKTGGTGDMRFLHDESASVQDFLSFATGDEFDWFSGVLGEITVNGSVEITLRFSMAQGQGHVPAGIGQLRGMVLIGD